MIEMHTPESLPQEEETKSADICHVVGNFLRQALGPDIQFLLITIEPDGERENTGAVRYLGDMDFQVIIGTMKAFIEQGDDMQHFSKTLRVN